MSYFDPKFEAKFGEHLAESGFIARPLLQEALKTSKQSNQSLIHVLCREHSVDEAALYKLLSEKTGVAYKNLKEETIDPEVVKNVPVKVAWHYGFMPMRFDPTGDFLVIAVDCPFNIKIQDEIRLQLGHALLQVLSKRRDIVDCFKKYYGFAADTVDKIVSHAEFEGAEAEAAISSIESTDRLAGDATVVDLVNEIIFEAYQKRATDIHFEPYRGEFRVRYRIDGVLQDAHLSAHAKPIIAFILSRIKIMANLDIIEKRLPQDGRAVVKIKNQTLDLRISSIPTLNGESIVVRILPTQMIFDLKKLGLTDGNIEIFEKLIKKPNGIVLLTGPTGSGKTTTLYACIHKINSSERKIITIEDPVEYEISGITQIQISPKSGLDFAKGLRSMLRHDPDVMMVGEIRDFETAEISIRAALTGHLVFSTLHTNDAASGVTRLLDIGLEPFLVASSLEAIIAQRLVRKICTQCKVADTAQPAGLLQKIARDLNLKSASAVPVFKGRGCENCGFTGFYGRLAIHEVLVTSEGVKALVMKKASSYEIKARAMQDGMLTLLQDGWLKVVDGQTTPGEVINVASAETPQDSSPEEPALDGFSPPPAMDQRAYQRTSVPIKVRYIKIFYKISAGKREKPALDTRSEYIGTAENISASGLLMRVDRLLAFGEILDLRFEPEEGSARIIQCLGRVVRLEETEEGDTAYKAGMVFLDLTSADRAYLDNFVLAKRGAVI